ACDELPCKPGVISASGLHREAIDRATSWSSHSLAATQFRLACVILNEIRISPQVALGLPMPKDDRLLKIARELLDRPDDSRSLECWAQWAGIAPRTLTRRFVAET